MTTTGNSETQEELVEPSPAQRAYLSRGLEQAG